jgi:hypothetical protein
VIKYLISAQAQMGEEHTTMAIYPSTVTSSAYATSFPATSLKMEDNQNGQEMHYALPVNETFCLSDDKSMDSKMFAEVSPTYHQSIHDRPQLHHMPSISTTCTSDSFHSSLASADSGELSAYDLHTSESQDYDWSTGISQQTHFQWPPNRDSSICETNVDNLATPPLESPVSFQQLHFQQHAPVLERRPSFPTAIPTQTTFYPLTSPTSRRPSQSQSQGNLSQFSFPNTTNQLYSRSNGGTSQSTTPTLQSPELDQTPRPTKKGSISTDVPMTRNRGLSLIDLDSAKESRRRSSLSTSNHLRSPNRHVRRSSAIATTSTFTFPLQPEIFMDDKQKRSQVKRSKSSNALQEEEEVTLENDSSGDGDDKELAKTKAARAQSEHRRRLELKESFEKLRLALGVPQPRAGKKDLVEQAIRAIDYHKGREMELLQEIQYLRQQQKQKYLFPLKCR